MSVSVLSFPVSLHLTGDLERKFDLEISPLCNQQADSVPTIQIGEASYCKIVTSYIIQKVTLPITDTKK